MAMINSSTGLKLLGISDLYNWYGYLYRYLILHQQIYTRLYKMIASVVKFQKNKEKDDIKQEVDLMYESFKGSSTNQSGTGTCTGSYQKKKIGDGIVI